MSTSPIVSPASLAIAIVLGGIAALLWLFQLGTLNDLTGSDAAGNGMAQGFAAIAIVLLWLLLAIITALAYAKGTMPGWAAIAALVLIPASGVVSLGVLGLLTAPNIAPYRWPLVIPGLVPPLVIVFGIWALLPSLHTRLPAPMTAGVVWGLILLLCLAYIPMQQVRDNARVRLQAVRAQFDADLNQVPADAPLSALAAFLGKGNYVQNERVVARISKLPHRQADTEAMLARGDFPLRYLGRFDLAPTPALCENARALLRKRAAALTLATPDSKPYADVAGEVTDAVAALRWLIDYDCPAIAEAEAWEAAAKSYSDPGYSLYELRDLRDPKRLGRKLNEDPDHFSMLTPRAHLKAWLKFADDKSLRDQAIEGAAKLDRRTADAIELFGKDDFETRVLTENLARLNLEPTPALCRAALGNLRQQFAAIYRPRPDDPRSYHELLGRLGRGGQFSALIWLASHGCDADAVLNEAIALIKAYQPSPDSGLMLGRLEALKRKT